MPKFQICYEVHHRNGMIDVEAKDKTEARAKFKELKTHELLENCEGATAKIEAIAQYDEDE